MYGEWVPNVTFTDSQSDPIATEDFGSNGTHLKIGIRRVLKESDVTIKCSVAFLSPPPAVIGSYQSMSSVDFIRNEVFVLNLTNGKFKYLQDKVHHLHVHVISKIILRVLSTYFV